MADLSLSFFGGFQVLVAGEPANAFESDKVRALLAYLAIEADHPHRRERLAGLLWPERTERNARQNLSQVLFNLRRAIGDHEADPPFLHVTHHTLQFNQGSNTRLDTAEFEQQLAAYEYHDHTQLAACEPCLKLLHQAINLYQGELLAGFSLSDSRPFEEWLLLTQARYHHLAAEAMHSLAAAYEQRREYDNALWPIRRLIDLNPWSEEAHRRFMRLLALNGQRREALTHFEVFSRLLAEEPGDDEPEAETIALIEQICSGASIHSLTSTPPLISQLPAPLTSLVGREKELATLTHHLVEPTIRLVTIWGPGGIGKTHLALAVGADQVVQFAHGVFFVELADLSSPTEILPAIAKSLNFTFYQGESPAEQLQRYLQPKTLLLILDNFEHLLAGRNVVIDLLHAAPNLKVLITSRTRLNLQGETLYPLAGLHVPNNLETRPQTIERYGAIQLFLQSVRRVLPDFAIDDENATDVAQICRLVEGLPLGILLATNWIPLLSPAEIATQLSSAITQSLDLLTTEQQDLPARQRNIRAVFEHSWQMLSQAEQQAFEALAVFRGGCTRQAAQTVSKATLSILLNLVNKSFLQTGQAGRYEIHPLLRQFGQEKLAATDRLSAVCAAHSDYFLNCLQGRAEGKALAALDADHENVRLAWNWAVDEQQHPQLTQALDALMQFYNWRGRYQEGEATCRQTLDRLTHRIISIPRPLGVRLLSWQGYFNWRLGLPEPANQCLTQALTLLNSSPPAELETQNAQAFALLQLAESAVMLTIRPPKNYWRKVWLYFGVPAINGARPRQYMVWQR